eukprot:2417538-Prymnesium_polylepis.1
MAPSSIETSSTTSAAHCRHRRSDALPTILACSTAADSRPMPIPANEWTVVPPMWHAAMPVDAVTKTCCRPWCACSAEMIWRR